MVGEVGADPTTLFRGTVLQTAEFADSLYSPIFRGADFALIIPTGGLVRLCSKLVPRSIVGAPHLYPYCITTWAVCQEVFYIFFERCFDLHFHRQGKPLSITLCQSALSS